MMGSIEDIAGLLGPLGSCCTNQLQLDTVLLFTSERELANAESAVWDIYSDELYIRCILKEQQMEERAIEVRCCCREGVTAGLVSCTAASLPLSSFKQS